MSPENKNTLLIIILRIGCIKNLVKFGKVVFEKMLKADFLFKISTDRH